MATGTLALGINMPCKTVVFIQDSAFLSALNYRQAAGRSGRRGFDPLGNVIFHRIPRHRVFEIMSGKLPDLHGQFPMTTTLILRLFSLLHQTNNSPFAQAAFEGLLSQTRLYLGGPDNAMAVKHHVRFSIDYLRRQHLLSATGAPLNFTGLVGHLYYTENSVFAFHALIAEGYFHELCADIDRKPDKVMRDLVLVLSHIFCRFPCPWYRNTKLVEEKVHRSSSIVFLPRLPWEAEQILLEHNKSTLRIFRNYALTFIQQHLQHTPDNILPFTNKAVGPADAWPRPSNHLPPPTIRSHFAALSGFTDEFKTIDELCSSVRGGVFLEGSAVPFLPTYPDETADVPFNAYIYDFFLHGDMEVLKSANGIKSGDVWFRLNDFSLILATIVTSLTGFVDSSVDPDLIVVDDDPDDADFDELLGGDDYLAAPELVAVEVEATAPQKPKPKKKEAVADSWEDEVDSDEEDDKKEVPRTLDRSETQAESLPSWESYGDGNLLKVLKAFKMLQAVFNEKFHKVWA